jgi:hypothetical protein
LGKISDVGLFTDRSEVTVTHQSTDELRAKLREKLVKLTKPVQSVQLGGEIIDVDAELGLKPPPGADSEEEVGQLAEILVPESEVGVQDD